MTTKNDNGLTMVIIETLNERHELMDYSEVQELLEVGNGWLGVLIR